MASAADPQQVRGRVFAALGTALFVVGFGAADRALRYDPSFAPALRPFPHGVALRQIELVFQVVQIGEGSEWFAAA